MLNSVRVHHYATAMLILSQASMRSMSISTLILIALGRRRLPRAITTICTNQHLMGPVWDKMESLVRSAPPPMLATAKVQEDYQIISRHSV